MKYIKFKLKIVPKETRESYSCEFYFRLVPLIEGGQNCYGGQGGLYLEVCGGQVEMYVHLDDVDVFLDGRLQGHGQLLGGPHRQLLVHLDDDLGGEEGGLLKVHSHPLHADHLVVLVWEQGKKKSDIE